MLHMHPYASDAYRVCSRMLTSAVRYQVSLIGLDKRFVESELKIVDSLRSGSALLHHLEPSYYAAIRTALDAKETSLSLPSAEKCREKQPE